MQQPELGCPTCEPGQNFGDSERPDQTAEPAADQCDAEPAVADPESVADFGDAWQPIGIDQTVDEEQASSCQSVTLC